MKSAVVSALQKTILGIGIVFSLVSVKLPAISSIVGAGSMSLPFDVFG